MRPHGVLVRSPGTPIRFYPRTNSPSSLWWLEMHLQLKDWGCERAQGQQSTGPHLHCSLQGVDKSWRAACITHRQLCRVLLPAPDQGIGATTTKRPHRHLRVSRVLTLSRPAGGLVRHSDLPFRPASCLLQQSSVANNDPLSVPPRAQARVFLCFWKKGDREPHLLFVRLTPLL